MRLSAWQIKLEMSEQGSQLKCLGEIQAGDRNLEIMIVIDDNVMKLDRLTKGIQIRKRR